MIGLGGNSYDDTADTSPNLDGGFTNVRSSNQMADTSRFGGVTNEVAPQEQEHKLDSPPYQKRFRQLKEWFDQEWHRQAANRYQMALDEDYYDGLQYSEAEAQELLLRGQAPLVFNEVKSTIDWMIGTERRTRIDHKVLARREDEEPDAEVKGQLLKYLSDTNKTVYHRSGAFADCVKAGLGWIEIGIRGDATEEPLYERKENWRNILYDSNGVENDLSDSRYVFRWKWLDQDIAEVYFPDRIELIQRSANDSLNRYGVDMQDEIWYMGARVTEPGQDYQSSTTGKYQAYNGSAFTHSRRKRVKLIEAWYRLPVLKKYFGNGMYQNEQFDSSNPEHVEALKGGYSLYDKIEMEIRCAIYCAAGLLFDGPTPYSHGRFPLVPIWCYRRKRDNAPYGMIRGMRDPQDDLNKRKSKTLWILSSNRVIMDEDAVEDVDELREEVARPDAIIIKKANKQFEISNDMQLADGHLKLMEMDQEHIRNTGGVTSENLGQQSNATSGKAITARQDQGTVVTTEPFDNLRFAVQLTGEMKLSNIKQYYVEEKVVRITGERGQTSWVKINKMEDDGTIVNDVTKSDCDFVVSDQDYRSSLRQAMFESLFDIVGRLAQMNPQVALNLLDLVVDMADLPNKDELVQRIRQLNGQRDPSKKPTKEELAQQAKQQQKADMQEQIALANMQAQLKELISKGEFMDSQAIMKRVEAMYAALQAAQIVAVSPAAATIADHIMQGSGFQDNTQQQEQVINDAAQQIDPNQPPLLPAPSMPAQPDQANIPNSMPQSGMEGVTNGIETPENDGMRG